MSVHVRFAPSPTGSLHLGGALTALLNRLFASRHGGTLLLRVDDTDTERSRPELEAGIMRDLRWLGIGWDEGPVRQSDRFERYREAASGAHGVEIRDGACWLRPSGLPPFVILRGDGRATYNWASAMDDLQDGITHVIRGNDHLSNTPLQQAAIRAVGADPPKYIHHAVITGEAGKLSKREGASSIADLRMAGYPAEAVVNYLGLIGSSGPGDVLSMDDLVARFDESRIARGTLQLDMGRLRALSTRHLAALPADDLVARVLDAARPAPRPRPCGRSNRRCVACTTWPRRSSWSSACWSRRSRRPCPSWLGSGPASRSSSTSTRRGRWSTNCAARRCRCGRRGAR